MENEREVLLEVNHLNVTYGSGKKAYEAVQDANFKIYKGETFGLVGESGSGKTTIGRAILRILPTSGGEILYKGQKINGRISRQLDRQIIKEIQMIFQDPQSSLNERAKVSYIVGEGLQNVRPDLSTAQQEEKVRQALLDVGLLPEFASRFPHEFSGGQRQRIGIARALIVEPEFIVADEPISALDMSIRAQVLNLLRRLQKERGITYLFIAHDLSVMRYISDRIAVIHKGRIVELAGAEELTAHAIHPYTRSLLSAIPMPDPRRERQKKLLVYDPAMHDYSREAPQWRELRPEHFVLCSAAEAEQWLAAALTPDISGGTVVLRHFYATFKVYFLTFSGSSTTIESASLILIFELLACSDRRLSSSLQSCRLLAMKRRRKKETRTLFYDY